MTKYLIAMGIRLVCLVLVFVVPGWWTVLPILGAVVLPYVAMIVANVGSPAESGTVERPGGLEVYRPTTPGYPMTDQPAPETASDEKETSATDEPGAGSRPAA